jgi:hypothetical protein
VFRDPRSAGMYSIVRRHAGDSPHGWIPNAGGTRVMIRSARLRVEAHPVEEAYFCTPVSNDSRS